MSFSDSIAPLAKLITVCVGEENLPGWVCVEDDEKTKPPFWCPLLACRLPVFTPKMQDLKVSERQPTNLYLRKLKKERYSATVDIEIILHCFLCVLLKTTEKLKFCYHCF